MAASEGSFVCRQPSLCAKHARQGAELQQSGEDLIVGFTWQRLEVSKV